MIGDPFLNYFALGVLFFVVVVLFYGIIAIHPALLVRDVQHLATRLAVHRVWFMAHQPTARAGKAHLVGVQDGAQQPKK